MNAPAPYNEKLIRLIHQYPHSEPYKIAQVFYETKKPRGGQVSAISKMMHKLSPQEPFMTKSTFTRTMDLSEAYRINKRMRDNLNQVRERDIMLYPVDRLRIGKEIHRLDTWIYETEQILMVEFKEI